MNNAQRVAFEGANNPALTADMTTLLFGGLLLVITLFWFAWVCGSGYKQFCKGGNSGDFGAIVLRAIVIVMLMLFFVGT